MAPLRIPRQILVLLYRRAGDGHEVLLLRRTPEREGFWQGVTGGPEQGEDDAGAAIREVKEETGLDVADRLVALDFRYAYAVREDWRREIYGPDVDQVTEEVYAAEVSTDADVRLSREHLEYRWCSFEEAEGLLYWPENVEALHVLRRRLQ